MPLRPAKVEMEYMRQGGAGVKKAGYLHSEASQDLEDSRIWCAYGGRDGGGKLIVFAF